MIVLGWMIGIAAGVAGIEFVNRCQGRKGGLIVMASAAIVSLMFYFI